MERIETGKRVGAAEVHIPRFCGRTALRGSFLFLTLMRLSSPGGWKENIPSRSIDGFSGPCGKISVEGCSQYLSWKLRLVVKIIPLPTTIVAQRAQTNKPTRPSSITLRGGISSDAKLCSADDRRSLYGTKDGACLSTATCELGDLAPQRRRAP